MIHEVLQAATSSCMKECGRWVLSLGSGPMTPAELKRFVGRQVMIARESTGLKANEFASRIGISQSQLWNIENAKAFPPEVAIVAACNEFGLSADWFYRGVISGATEDAAKKLREAVRNFSVGDIAPSSRDADAG